MVVRERPVAQLDSQPFGLNVRLLPSAPRQLGSGGKPRQKGEGQGFGISGRPCGVQAASPRTDQLPWAVQQKSDPRSLAEGAQELQGSLLGLAEQSL